MATSELDYLRRMWPPWALFAFMTRYQQDLEHKRNECKERFGCTQSGNCTHCGKNIQRDLGKHIAFYHLELAQLWCCPDMWCMVWKGTAQDCIDHMRRTHKVSLSVKVANLARFFPAWTFTREQWADMIMPSISGVAIDTLLFSHIGSPLCHRYQPDRKPRGFPGYVPTSSACLPQRIRLRGGTPAPPSAFSRTFLPYSAACTQSAVGHRIVSRSRRPRRLKGVSNSAGGPESVCRLPAEMSSVQALMDLALPRFAGLADGPRQVHPPWSVASDSVGNELGWKRAVKMTHVVRWTKYWCRQRTS